ncbi:MAG TPA: hypothetical protein VF789_18360 [Thermoanaerobaculia bacterium]
MRTKAILVFLLLPGLSPLAAPARDLTGEVEVSAFGSFDRVASMNGRGEVLVAWQDGVSTNGRLFSPDNAPRGPEFEISEPTQEYLGSLGASLDSRGFSVVWDQQGRFGGSTSFRRFDAGGDPVTGPAATLSLPSVDTNARGDSVVIGGNLQGQRYDSAGRKVGPPFQVAPVTVPISFFTKVAVDGRGNFVVIWKTQKNELLGRRMDAGGQPRGPVFQIAPAVGAAFDLAGNGQGGFVALWTSSRGLQARIYKPTGEAVRGAIQVARGVPTSRLSVAMDAAGRVLATWDCCVNPEVFTPKIFGRFFEASGAPLDGPFQVGLRTPDRDLGPDAAAGPAGEFFVAWQRFSGETSPLLGRRLQWARRGDDLCRFGVATGFACDVAHDGGGPAVTSIFGQTGDQPFLADLDGDGRDDYCVYRGGSFLCDTAHDGGDAEAGIAFQGGFPLMADLDGDGRDDPCVRVGGQVHCDTAHNGGTAEVVVTFGDGTEPLRLGDEDGDGDDDVCLLGDGVLLCDTGDDGGAAEARIPFRPASGERFLLGDVNGDGRDDPCLVRGDRLLCDTAHRGALTATFPFTPGAGEVPLLGDVNGI